MRVWSFIKRLYAFFIPIRFSFLALAVLVFAFWLSDQGLDILRALVEDRSPGEHLRMTALLGASLLLAFAIWYWSRNLLCYRPHGEDEWPEVAKWTPRILGLAVFLVEIVGFVIVARQYKVEYPAKLWWTIFLLIVCGIVFWIVVVMRRRLLHISETRTVRSWSEVESTTKAVLLGSIVLEILALVWAWVNPVSWHFLGVAAVLVLTVGVWVPLGSALVGLGEKWRFPVIGFLVVWAFAISRWTDNHPVRKVPGPVQEVAMQQAFDAWYARVQQQHPPGQEIPVFVVATEGGGIRAAAWTTSVLTHLQTDIPAFADHCFAISSVSGGSLGAITFNALLARRNELAKSGAAGASEPLPDQAKRFLNFDALSGTLAAMAQPDLLQRFVPFPYFPDRAAALEHGWEAGWRHAFGENENRFAHGLLAMSAAHPELPHLFINGTMVETGDRIITSAVDVRSLLGFRDAFDAFDQLQSDIPLSTGANMSARFAYVAPAGIMANPQAEIGHVIDGGYFENSGGVTASEVVAFLFAQRQAGARIRPVVIVIDYWENPSGDSTGPFCPSPGQAGPSPLPPARFAIDVLAPLWGLTNTRSARGVQAVGDLSQQMRLPDGRQNMVEFRLIRRNVPLPLGWVLSERAMQTIDQAVHDEEGNRKAVAIVADLIAGHEPQLPSCDGGSTAPEKNMKGVNP